MTVNGADFHKIRAILNFMKIIAKIESLILGHRWTDERGLRKRRFLLLRKWRLKFWRFADRASQYIYLSN